MSKFPQNGQTREGHAYTIHHINNDGSMCGEIYMKGKFTAVNWQADGSTRTGAMGLDIVPKNTPRDLLERLANSVKRAGGGSGGSGQSITLSEQSITMYVSVPENLYNQVCSYLREQERKS